MIAQRTKTNNVVEMSDVATVQAAVKLLTRKPVMLYRWECEVCGMVHTGSLPTACDSCGKEGPLVHRPDMHLEMHYM